MFNLISQNILIPGVMEAGTSFFRTCLDTMGKDGYTDVKSSAAVPFS